MSCISYGGRINNEWEVESAGSWSMCLLNWLDPLKVNYIGCNFNIVFGSVMIVIVCSL